MMIIEELLEPEQKKYKVYGMYCDTLSFAEYYKNMIETTKWKVGSVLGDGTDIIARKWTQATNMDEGYTNNFPRELVGTTKVMLVNEYIEVLQSILAQYGPNVAIRHKHIGMGNHKEEVVVLEPNPLQLS